eukprot:10082126-Heterocapsa_arctica.AAC.1
MIKLGYFRSSAAKISVMDHTDAYDRMVMVNDNNFNSVYFLNVHKVLFGMWRTMSAMRYALHSASCAVRLPARI